MLEDNPGQPTTDHREAKKYNKRRVLKRLAEAKHQGAIVVDRATKFLVAVTQAICDALALIGKQGLIHTRVSDHGTEFSLHQLIVKEEALSCLGKKPE
jgi:IS30 family transposase